jgi:adenosine kinase
VKGVVGTPAGQGCAPWINGKLALVPGVSSREVVDLTGCGDALRVALLCGLERGWPLLLSAELGRRLSALKIAQRRRQNLALDVATKALLD